MNLTSDILICFAVTVFFFVSFFYYFFICSSIHQKHLLYIYDLIILMQVFTNLNTFCIVQNPAIRFSLRCKRIGGAEDTPGVVTAHVCCCIRPL